MYRPNKVTPCINTYLSAAVVTVRHCLLCYLRGSHYCDALWDMYAGVVSCT